MFEQHAGSHTHNLLNRARGGTLLCTRGPCPLVPLASYGPEIGSIKISIIFRSESRWWLLERYFFTSWPLPLSQAD